MIYVLDTNVISDYLITQPDVVQQVHHAFQDRHTLLICRPVYYELRRGLMKNNATRKLDALERDFIPRLVWEPLHDADWLRAAQFWADTTSAGRQLSDMDLLIAAVADRLDAVLVSSDDDFAALPIQRRDWRSPR